MSHFRRMHSQRAAALLLSSSLLFTGCARKVESDVAAKVNGRPIYTAEVDRYYRTQTAGAPQPPSPEQEQSMRLGILRQLVDNEILEQQAEKLGLVAGNDEVDAKLAEFKSPYTPVQFDQKLKERGISEDDFKRDLKRSLTVDKVVNKEITSKIAVTDADIANYYAAHKAEFNLIEPQYHLAQIQVTDVPQPVSNLKNDKARNEAEARKKIQRLHNQLESGEDFATLAMNYSEQPGTAGSGGDIGFVSEQQLKVDPNAYAAITRLKAGQITDVLPLYDAPGSKRVMGYSIFKLLAKEPAGQRDLNDPRVQQAIRQELRERREQLLKAAYYETLRDRAKIDNYYADQILRTAK